VCYNISSVAQQPTLDLARVVSAESRTQMLQESASRRQARTSESWKAYDVAKAGYFKEHSQAKLAALKAARATDFQNYVKWLDAKAVEDMVTQTQLERTVPALIEYLKQDREAYNNLYKEKADMAYEAYKAQESQIWADFRQEERQIWQAWTKLSK
jgi:hypothetical protein